MMKFLFICSGNICRSPMAEVIFRNIVKKHNRRDIIVKSAGTHAEIGAPMSDFSRAALLECGEELPETEHKSTRLTPEMLKSFDHVIDCRYIPGPYLGDREKYVGACKQLQKDLAALYDKTCRI
jgi:protein-tyrosine-phosphatase